MTKYELKDEIDALKELYNSQSNSLDTLIDMVKTLSNLYEIQRDQITRINAKLTLLITPESDAR